MPDTVDAQFLITWLETDPTDSGHIWLYYDNNNYGNSGVDIGADNIPVWEPNNGFLWNTTSMFNGSYWILAKIQNVNGTVYAYSPAPVVIHHVSGINPWPGLEGIPAQFALQNVYPNPFNNSATIRVALPREAQVQIRVYDTLGRLAATPFQGRLEPGYHDVPWTPNFLPSGMYLVRFSAPGLEMQTKVVYLK